MYQSVFLASLGVNQNYMYTSSDDGCVQSDSSIKPMELEDEEEQQIDRIAASKVLMNSDVKLALETPPVCHQVYKL